MAFPCVIPKTNVSTMKYFNLLAGFLICALSACQKDNTANPSTDITGRWRWVKSQGSIAGNTVSPATEGYQQTQVYGADSTFKMYKNDSLKLEGKYSIKRNFKYQGETVDLLKIADEYDRSFTIRNDTLFTYDIMITEGYSSVYVRVR
jgi:hypothetical protein